MKHHIKASIDIDAPPERVWQVLLDFPRYPQWSTFLTRIEGVAEPGIRLRVSLQLPADEKLYEFKPMVLQVTKPHTFRWLGRLGVPGIFDGEHGFFLEYLFGGRTRLRHCEEFHGFLAPFLWRRIESPTTAGFTAFNQALKHRAESLPEYPF